MSAFIMGQQSVCLCALLILMISLFTDRRREQALSLMLCAAVLIFSAITMNLFNASCVYVDGLLLFRISRVVAVTFTVAGGGALAGFFRVWKPSNRTNRWTALTFALIPVWVAGLGWLFRREIALFSIAETISLLIVSVIHQKDMETVLKERAEDIENHQAMLFQWQMRPHFLFNTISTIRELLDSDPALASSGLDNLSGYLRKNLDALAFDHMIPFARELEHIEQYVALEKMNPSNRFEVVYDLQIIDFALPALSVQPLVENAIRHGVRSMGDEGMIFVVTERHGEMIRVIVEDNGPGFPQDETPQRKEHISRGLENVRRRLETQCDGSLHIHSDKSGTRVIALIPKKGGYHGNPDGG